MLNSDMSEPVVVHTANMPWQDSPGARVKRKRLHLVGEPESGQVTSLVTYLPQAKFPTHAHPEGEEILVLEGVFSDESGDYPAGTHLLNPEGFAHAPFSTPGCLLFVKLRQYPGRQHQQQKDRRGCLFSNGKETTHLLDIEEERTFACPDGAEVLVITGGCRANDHNLTPHDWARWPAGTTLKIIPDAGPATIYLKQNGVSQLRTVQC